MDFGNVIIGAGVIGLAIAAELTDGKDNVLLIEKESSHGKGVSSRNSEVIHAGMYYPAESLKARLCVEGRKRLYEICQKNNIGHKKIGKLIIATSPDEMDQIEILMQKAVRNGISSVSMKTQSQIRRLEPNIKAYGGLYSPETGIISSHDLMNFYLRKALMNGAEIVYGTEVINIQTINEGFLISTVSNQGENFDFSAERVINAAGLQSDTIARLVGKEYTLYYCKGDYFSLADVNRSTVSRLVYPVPEKNHVGLGVHLTLDLGGRMKLGPDATYIDRIEDYKVCPEKISLFYEAAAKFLPFLKKENLVPDFAGIRPKLQGPEDTFSDFVISQDLNGFINLVGIESPGLTSSPAIARYVKDLLEGRSQK